MEEEAARRFREGQRRHKAIVLADALAEICGGADLDQPEHLQSAPLSYRRSLARYAGVRDPSDETWSYVVGLVVRRRRFHGTAAVTVPRLPEIPEHRPTPPEPAAPADPFENL